MHVTISSRKTKVSPRLEEVTREKIGRLDRYLDGMDRAEVHFFEEQNPRIRDKEVCEVTLEGHGHHVRCKVAAPDGFSAVDAAVDKLEHQLHKLKSKLVDRYHGTGKELPFNMDATIPEIAPPPGPNIVKSKRFLMSPISAKEAAQEMELLDHGFFFFTNEETGRAAVVYRREDGDVGLIDEDG